MTKGEDMELFISNNHHWRTSPFPPYRFEQVLSQTSCSSFTMTVMIKIHFNKICKEHYIFAGKKKARFQVDKCKPAQTTGETLLSAAMETFKWLIPFSENQNTKS